MSNEGEREIDGGGGGKEVVSGAVQGYVVTGKVVWAPWNYGRDAPLRDGMPALAALLVAGERCSGFYPKDWKDGARWIGSTIEFCFYFCGENQALDFERKVGEYVKEMKHRGNPRVESCEIQEVVFTPGDVETVKASHFLRWAKEGEGVDLGFIRHGFLSLEDVAEALKVNKTVRGLSFFGCKIGGAGAVVIADVLRVNETVRVINLWDNGIGDKGAVAVAEVLKVNRTLREVIIGGNGIGDEGAVAVGEGLKVNRTVRKILLWGNELGDAGARAIAEGLRVNGTVTEVDFEFNNIGDDGAVAIGEALGVNRAVREINLRKNKIGDRGGVAIAEALKVNTTLREIDLGGNRIGDEGAAAIGEALRVNRTLTRIDLGLNGIGDDGAQAIADAISSDPSALVPLRPAQRLAFFQGTMLNQKTDRGERVSVVRKLPLDMVKRILLGYDVAQGAREWDWERMTTRK